MTLKTEGVVPQSESKMSAKCKMQCESEVSRLGVDAKDTSPRVRAH